MTLLRRSICSFTDNGGEYLGGVDLDDRQFVARANGKSAAEAGEIVQAKTFHNLPAPELDIFRDANTLLAFRNGETADAIIDWLQFHKRHIGVGGALVVNRARNPDEFANALGKLELPVPVILVHADRPLGQPDGMDMRHPATAPAARLLNNQAPVNVWHSPLRETVVFDLLRYRFLSTARAVAALSIADLILPDQEQSPFDLADTHCGEMVLFQGVEVYPKRLRKDAPAPFWDHVNLRRKENRWISSWCVAPRGLSDKAVWQPGRMMNVAAAETRPVSIRRAMGVSYPGVPPEQLVDKSELREDSALAAVWEQAFGKVPIRSKKRAQKQDAPKGGVTVVSVMKNEGPFILDWVAHNKAIGVDSILVYTNECLDGTDRLLDLLGQAGVIRRDNPYLSTGAVPQLAAFRAAEKEPVVQGASWLMTLDVDEYLNIHAGDGSIRDLIAATDNPDAISIPWRLFGNNDVHNFNDVPVSQQFEQCAAEYTPRPIHAWAFKTLYANSGLFRRLGVHRPKGIVGSKADRATWVNGSGVPISPTQWPRFWRMNMSTWGYDLAQINHYAVRSAESFLVKRERGRVNHVDREQGTNYWFRMNINAEADRSIRRLDERVNKMKRELLALPGVAEAHAQAVDWHQERIKKLLQEPDYERFFRSITSDRMQRLSRLHGHFGMSVYIAGPEVIPDEVTQKQPSDDFFLTV